VDILAAWIGTNALSNLVDYIRNPNRMPLAGVEKQQ